MSSPARVQHAPTYEADPDLGAGDTRRVLLGYARVVDRMKFALPTVGDEPIQHVFLEVDEIVSLLQPNEIEEKRLRAFANEEAFQPTRHVVYEWQGKRRYVPAASLVGQDERGAKALRGGG